MEALKVNAIGGRLRSSADDCKELQGWRGRAPSTTPVITCGLFSGRMEGVGIGCAGGSRSRAVVEVEVRACNLENN